ncbi:MAG: hypothetical protein AAFR67_13310, partial [Chloroflexota bacterium]
CSVFVMVYPMFTQRVMHSTCKRIAVYTIIIMQNNSLTKKGQRILIKRKTRIANKRPPCEVGKA